MERISKPSQAKEQEKLLHDDDHTHIAQLAYLRMCVCVYIASLMIPYLRTELVVEAGPEQNKRDKKANFLITPFFLSLSWSYPINTPSNPSPFRCRLFVFIQNAGCFTTSAICLPTYLPTESGTNASHVL